MLRSLVFTALSRNALVAATVSALTLAAPVYAADPPPPSDPTARAEWLSGQAELAFSDKRFADAIRLYLDAWEAAPAASILYNVAFIYDKRLADPELAIDYYERAAASPDADAELKTKAAARVTALRAELANKPADKPKIEVPITPPSESSVAPWIITATGGALLAGGIAMAFVASGTESDFQAADSAAEKRSLQSDGRTQALVADLLMGVGAVGVATGVIWLLVEGGSSPESRVGPVDGALRLEPRFIPGGAAFVLGGTL